MAPPRDRPPHLVGAQFHRQPVDQFGHLAFAARFLDQAVLRRTQRLAPARLEQKGVEPEPGVEFVGLVDQQAPQMLGLAARQRGRRRRHRNLAIDAIAAQHQPPHAEPPLRQYCDQFGHQQVERLARRARIGDRLGKADSSARRRLARRGGERFGLAPEHPVERVERIVRLAKAPRQAPPRHSGKLADGLQPEQLERPRRPRGEPQRGNGQGGEQVVQIPVSVSPLPFRERGKGRGARGESCQPPRRPGRRGQRHAACQLQPRKPRLDIAQ